MFVPLPNARTCIYMSPILIHRSGCFRGQIWQIFDPESGFPEDVPARNHVPCEFFVCHVM